MAEVVVGVDGSAHADEALRWALEEARIRGATLRAVHAARFPDAVSIEAPGFVLAEAQEALRHQGERVLADAVERVLGDAGPGVDVRREVVELEPAEALIESAEGADLLVVGSRGLGGFAGLLLGSVGQQCVHHAPCPVVVVPTAGD